MTNSLYLHHMSSLLATQSADRKIQIFKQSLKFQESAAGVVVQRIPGSHLYRILKPLIAARKEASDAGRNPDHIDPQKFVPDRTDTLINAIYGFCLLYTSPSPRDRTRSRMPSSA